MLVVLHNPAHNGDLLFSQPFVKIFVESNPNINFKLMLSCCQLLYKDIINDNNNCTFFEGRHPSPWVGDKNHHDKMHELFHIRDIPYHYDIEKQIIYINMWMTLTKNSDRSGYNGNRLDYIKNMINDIENMSGYRLQYNCNTHNNLLPILPGLNDEKTIGIMEKVSQVINSFEKKKIVFFYNVTFKSGSDKYEGDYNSNFISDLKKDENIVLLLLRYDRNHPTVLSLEENFDLPPSEDGYNLLISAKIAKLCHIVYMKQSGGSLFVVNDDNINNNTNNTEYHFLGPDEPKLSMKIYNLNVVN